MSLFNAARESLKSLLEDTDFYDPGSVEVALDAVASTLQPCFRLKLRKNASLGDVIEKLQELGEMTEEDVKSLERIQQIIDENSYPESIEIEEPAELEELVHDVTRSITKLLDRHARQ